MAERIVGRREGRRPQSQSRSGNGGVSTWKNSATSLADVVHRLRDYADYLGELELRELGLGVRRSH